jgi:F0F1-type ATP synthase gamma subunit
MGSPKPKAVASIQQTTHVNKVMQMVSSTRRMRLEARTNPQKESSQKIEN